MISFKNEREINGKLKTNKIFKRVLVEDDISNEERKGQTIFIYDFHVPT